MKYYLSLVLVNINIIYSYIKLPFKTYNSDDINYFYNNFLYINLDIGLPKQNYSKIVLKQGRYNFFLYDNTIYSSASYNSKSSTRFHTLVDDIFELTSSNCLKGISSMDTFFIQSQRFDNITFILCTKSKNNEYELFDGEIGLNLEYQSPPNSNFISILKNNEVINNYIYSINYINDNEGFLLIGEYPHKINSEYKAYNLNWIHSEISKNNFHWTVLFDKISYGNGDIYQAQREARLLNEIKYIISTGQYYNLFKDIFGSKCSIIHIDLDEDLQGFKCNKNINKELTPEIRFYNKALNMTFVLDYNDLYIEKGDYLYFLVAKYFEYQPEYWVLGKPFMKKYLFLFNYDSKMIGFYKSNDKDNDKHFNKNNYFSISIILNIVLIVIVIILVFIFCQYYLKKRRIRANELEDKFNYTAKEDK